MLLCRLSIFKYGDNLLSRGAEFNLLVVPEGVAHVVWEERVKAKTLGEAAVQG